MDRTALPVRCETDAKWGCLCNVYSLEAAGRASRHWRGIPGELALLIQQHDWAATALGPISDWSPTVQSAVDMMLRSPLAMTTLWGKDGILVYNDGYAAVAGRRHPALLGAKVEDAWPEAAAFNRGVLDEVLAGRSLKFHNQPLRLYRNDYPEDVWFDLYYSPIANEKGEIAGVLAVVVETTENIRDEELRKNAEEARRIGEELFRVAFANAATGMVLIDRNGGFIRSNAAYSAITGYSERELKYQNIFKITHPDDRERKSQLLQQVLDGTIQGGVLEKRYVRPDGSIVWVQNSVSKAPTSPSGEDTLIIITQDITERKRAEQALLHSNEEMQAFVYAASHDLREPLRTLASFTQLLARRYRGALDQDADEYIEHIVSAAKRMDALITDLLTYARAGRLEGMPMHPVDLRFVAGRVVEDLKTAIDESGANIEIGDLPVVRGNMQQLDQLLQNLVGNAIKYHRAGTPPRIQLSAKHREGEWIIAVKDNGRGFPQEHADYIFQVFKRLHGRDIPGTGIGLALCRRIVDRHGGRIWAESTPDVGSTFYFALPE